MSIVEGLYCNNQPKRTQASASITLQTPQHSPQWCRQGCAHQASYNVAKEQAEIAYATHLHRVNQQRERFTARCEMQHTNMKVDALLLLLPGDCCCGGGSSQRIGHVGVCSGSAPPQALLLQGAAQQKKSQSSTLRNERHCCSIGANRKI